MYFYLVLYVVFLGFFFCNLTQESVLIRLRDIFFAGEQTTVKKNSISLSFEVVPQN